MQGCGCVEVGVKVWVTTLWDCVLLAGMVWVAPLQKRDEMCARVRIARQDRGRTCGRAQNRAQNRA